MQKFARPRIGNCKRYFGQANYNKLPSGGATRPRRKPAIAKTIGRKPSRIVLAEAYGFLHLSIVHIQITNTFFYKCRVLEV